MARMHTNLRHDRGGTENQYESQDPRPMVSTDEDIGGNAKIPRQSADMIERELAFAAKYHRAKSPVNPEQAGQIRSAHLPRSQKMIQAFQSAGLRRFDLSLFIV